MDTLFDKYIAIEVEYKELEKKREALRKEIVAGMSKLNIDKQETEYGIFTVNHKVSWTYSDSVMKLEERLKLAKLKEQKKGIAISKETTEYLTFKPVKVA